MTGEYLAGTDIPLATSCKYKDTAELAPWFVSADTPESKITQHYPYIYRFIYNNRLWYTSINC